MKGLSDFFNQSDIKNFQNLMSAVGGDISAIAEDLPYIKNKDNEPYLFVADYDCTREVVSKDDDGKEVTSKVHQFTATVDNEVLTFVVWGKSSLNTQLGKLKEGVKVKVKYNGKKEHPTKKTRSFHSFYVKAL